MKLGRRAVVVKETQGNPVPAGRLAEPRGQLECVLRVEHAIQRSTVEQRRIVENQKRSADQTLRLSLSREIDQESDGSQTPVPGTVFPVAEFVPSAGTRVQLRNLRRLTGVQRGCIVTKVPKEPEGHV